MQIEASDLDSTAGHCIMIIISIFVAMDIVVLHCSNPPPWDVRLALHEELK